MTCNQFFTPKKKLRERASSKKKATSCVVKHRTAFSKKYDNFFPQPDRDQATLGHERVKNRKCIFHERTDVFKRGHPFSKRGQPESKSGHARVHARTVFWRCIVEDFPSVLETPTEPEIESLNLSQNYTT